MKDKCDDTNCLYSGLGCTSCKVEMKTLENKTKPNSWIKCKICNCEVRNLGDICHGCGYRVKYS